MKPSSHQQSVILLVRGVSIDRCISHAETNDESYEITSSLYVVLELVNPEINMQNLVQLVLFRNCIIAILSSDKIFYTTSIISACKPYKIDGLFNVKITLNTVS